MKRLYALALKLNSKGLHKQAQKVLDLTKKREQQNEIKNHNKDVLDNIKSEDRMQSILDQHQKDRPYVRFPEEDSRVVYPDAGAQGRRYKVHVSYPSFDDAGAPFFNEDSVNETLSVTKDELENLQKDNIIQHFVI